MDRRKPPGSSDGAARAFARVGWTRLLARLHRYATGTLRLAALEDGRADTVEAVDVVNTLVERGLSGSLAWTLPEHASDDEIVRYACSKLYGMRSTLRRQAAWNVGDDDALNALADEGPDAFALLLEQRGIAELRRAFGPDAEASAHLERMLEGSKRAEIAAELGCSVEHADLVRRRILRRIAALRADTNDQREDEPPSSGPRGTYHEPQATQERRGAAPEPHRGAGGAGRRR
jgi:hypothetical protein